MSNGHEICIQVHKHGYVVTFFVIQMYKEKKLYITMMIFSSTYEHMRLGDNIKLNSERLALFALGIQRMTGIVAGEGAYLTQLPRAEIIT